jgi:hypothetical protein
MAVDGADPPAAARRGLADPAARSCSMPDAALRSRPSVIALNPAPGQALAAGKPAAQAPDPPAARA